MSEKKGGTVTIQQRNVQKKKLTVTITGTPKQKYKLNKKPKRFIGANSSKGKKITASDLKKKK